MYSLVVCLQGGDNCFDGKLQAEFHILYANRHAGNMTGALCVFSGAEAQADRAFESFRFFVMSARKLRMSSWILERWIQ